MGSEGSNQRSDDRGSALAAIAARNPAETARYIAELTGELAAMATAARLPLLAYLLEMARLDAQKATGSDGSAFL